MRRMILALTVASLVFTSIINYGQAQVSNQQTQIDVRQLMSTQEFKSAGLHKLSPVEIKALNRWLGKFASQILQVSEGGGRCANVIESQIDGDFEGWDGETIFKLRNGQIWQQSSYAYTYHYAYSPEVTIFPSSNGCTMKVEDVSDSIQVKRLR